MSAPLWTVEAMAKAMAAQQSGKLPAGITGLSIDTRTVQPGEAFFAIKGDARDGHEFVDAALKAGAGLAVVAADKRDSFAKDAPLLVVSDVLEGLIALARAARARSSAKFIGVTGSVGKTGTKEMLRLLLGGLGETHAAVASYNNHWGVPLSLARLPQDTDYAVFEIGMNHAGEIAALAPFGVADGLVAWWPHRGRSGPFRHVLVRRLDDLAYGAGLWTGAVRARDPRALLPVRPPRG